MNKKNGISSLLIFLHSRKFSRPFWILMHNTALQCTVRSQSPRKWESLEWNCNCSARNDPNFLSAKSASPNNTGTSSARERCCYLIDFRYSGVPVVALHRHVGHVAHPTQNLQQYHHSLNHTPQVVKKPRCCRFQVLISKVIKFT